MEKVKWNLNILLNKHFYFKEPWTGIFILPNIPEEDVYRRTGLSMVSEKSGLRTRYITFAFYFHYWQELSMKTKQNI